MIPLTRQQEDLTKLLTYILCHRPDEFGLILDEEGFAGVKQLLAALAGEGGWGWVRRRHLEELAVILRPPAFELAGEVLRGLIPGPARLRQAIEKPPPLLYTAIPPKAQEPVFESGLKAGTGQDILLAATPERALKLGRRRSPEPILVTVQAQAAARKGIAFQGYGEGLFLTGAIPREFLQLPSPSQSREKPKPEKPAPPRPLPGSVLLDLPQFLEKPGSSRVKGKKAEPAWKSGTRALRRERRKPPK